MPSEGAHVIEAVKQRLAAANAQLKFARDMLAIAQRNVESSQNEANAAKASLKEAEKRWEVIDVDDSASASAGSPENKDRSNKRRKVNGSPDADGINEPHGNFVSDAWTLQSNIAIGGPYHPLEQVLVMGCGLSEVNGTYKREVGQIFGDIPRYSKRGQWIGMTVNFIICRSMSANWHIRIWSPSATTFNMLTLYQAHGSRNNDDFDWSKMPPETGWIVGGNGVEPAPELSLCL